MKALLLDEGVHGQMWQGVLFNDGLISMKFNIIDADQCSVSDSYLHCYRAFPTVSHLHDRQS